MEDISIIPSSPLIITAILLSFPLATAEWSGTSTGGGNASEKDRPVKFF
jgi:hypothetical protein